MNFRGEQIQAYTADQVCLLTGISRGQLSYWDKTDFFNPRFTHESTRMPYRNIYSFRDLVGLRAIAHLRDKVSLQELRRVGDYLKVNYRTPWSSLRFIVDNKKVYFKEPGEKYAFEAKEYGQGNYLVVDLEDMAKEVDERILEFKRPKGKISKNRYVVRNDSVIEGTRIRTEAIWNYHNQGYSIKAILKEYPDLTKKDVKAAIEFESKQRKDAA